VHEPGDEKNAANKTLAEASGTALRSSGLIPTGGGGGGGGGVGSGGSSSSSHGLSLPDCITIVY